jgi:hypothetical protein
VDRYLEAKYEIQGVNKGKLEEARKNSLYSEIEKKILHGKLHKAGENELVNLLDSSTWLKHGNNSPTEEAHFCNLQDRNIFKGAELQRQHCRTVKRTVDTSQQGATGCWRTTTRGGTTKW